MSPWRSRQPAHKQIQAMRETAHSFRKSTAQRRLRSPQKNSHSMVFTAGGHGIGTAAGHIVERLTHGKLVQTRIFKCGESSDDMALTSLTRGWLSDGACVRLLCRVPSHRSSGLLVPQCQGSRLARGGRARSGARMHTACGTCSTSTGKPHKLSIETKQPFEESQTVLGVINVQR
jgi:hypothetical protein